MEFEVYGITRTKDLWNLSAYLTKTRMGKDPSVIFFIFFLVFIFLVLSSPLGRFYLIA